MASLTWGSEDAFVLLCRTSRITNEVHRNKKKKSKKKMKKEKMKVKASSREVTCAPAASDHLTNYDWVTSCFLFLYYICSGMQYILISFHFPLLILFFFFCLLGCSRYTLLILSPYPTSLLILSISRCITITWKGMRSPKLKFLSTAFHPLSLSPFRFFFLFLSLLFFFFFFYLFHVSYWNKLHSFFSLFCCRINCDTPWKQHEQ